MHPSYQSSSFNPHPKTHTLSHFNTYTHSVTSAELLFVHTHMRADTHV